MELQFVDRQEETGPVARALTSARRLALDAEAAGFHRYSDRLSLLQLSIEPGTFILDPLALDVAPLLRGPLADPSVGVVMHGADFDIRLFRRDLGIQVTGLFDTQVAASLLGVRSIGLQSVLEEYLGVRLSKKYQRADWAQRPLPEEMLAYAAADTRYLLELADRLRDELQERGRLAWAEEEFRILEQVAFEDRDDEDPVVRVKDARKLDPREVARLREALEWRDQVARQRDRAPFRVAGDRALAAVAQRAPSDVEELARVEGFSPALARSSGPGLIERLRAIDRRPASEIRPFPRGEGNGRTRPEPEVEDRFRRLRDARNRAAERLGVDRGTLLSNQVLELLAREPPEDEDALAVVPDVRRWQVEAMGSDLLQALEE